MRDRIKLQYFFGMALISVLCACSKDNESANEYAMRPLEIKSVTYTPWGGITRSASYPDATDKEIWVSANDATPSKYAYREVSEGSNEWKYQVIQGSPQEWNGVTADVYGFFTSTNATRVNTEFLIAENQTGAQSYNFQASAKGHFTYSANNSDGVILALKQQLAHVTITVEDGNANTQVLIGNTQANQMYCSGMFQYVEPDAGKPKYHTSEGWWEFTGNRKTMTLTNPSGGNTFSAFILPQTITSASHFFRVYNTATGRSAYYALPSDNFSLEEGNEYTCTLRQNMDVASIQVDEDFSNNSGDTKNINTVPSN